MDIQLLSDDELYSAFADADERDNDELCRSLADEILRRAGDHPAPVVHEVPAFLARLPKLFWHQKPVGEGGG